MPTYEYECSKCGHNFDALQSMSEDPLAQCPSCGKNGLRRLIGGGLGVIFKGSGFYVTDSRGGNGGGRGSKAKTDSAGTDSSSGGESSDSSTDSGKTGSSKSDASSDTGKTKPKTESKAAT